MLKIKTMPSLNGSGNGQCTMPVTPLNLSHKAIFDMGMRHAVVYKRHGINISGYEISRQITDHELRKRISKTRDYIEALHEAKSVQEIARIIEIAAAIYTAERRNEYWE